LFGIEAAQSCCGLRGLLAINSWRVSCHSI